jgi:hypothetical protein
VAVVEQVMVIPPQRPIEQPGKLHRVEPDLLDEPEDVVVTDRRGVHRAAVQKIGPAEQAVRRVLRRIARAAEVGVVVFDEARVEHERAAGDERSHQLHRLRRVFFVAGEREDGG